MLMNCQSQSGQSNRGRCPKEACEALLTKNIAEDREDADDGAAHDEPNEIVAHRRLDRLLRFFDEPHRGLLTLATQ